MYYETDKKSSVSNLIDKRSHALCVDAMETTAAGGLSF
jgi:hypothetical protein